MKFQKTAIFLCIFLVGIYLCYLFVVPKIFDLKKLEPQIANALYDEIGIKPTLKNCNITTYWDFSLVATTERINLFKQDTKIAQINNLKINISVLPLLFKKIQITKIEADKILANIDNNDLFKEKQTTQNLKNSFTLSEKMPDIFVKFYRFSISDNNNIYKIKGNELKITDFSLNKKIKINTTGQIYFNDKKHITYNLDIKSKIFDTLKTSKESNQYKQITDFFKNLHKYNLKTDIYAKLNITEKDKEIDTKGDLVLDKLTFKVGQKRFPPSSIKLSFNGNNAKINSSLHLNDNDKAIITGLLKTGKHKNIELNVITDELKIEELLLIAKTILKTFNIADLSKISAKGLVYADFKLYSDFKKIKSKGVLKIKNATITENINNISINSLNANIDFSNNNVRIKEASAKFNEQPLNINGEINSDAIANILVTAHNLPLKGLLFTIGQYKLLKENDITGLLDIKAHIRGKLSDIKPECTLAMKNIDIKNKLSKIAFKISSISAKTIFTENTDAKVTINGIKAHLDKQNSIYIPQILLDVGKKDIVINNTNLWLNNIKTDLSGSISNYANNPTLSPVAINIPNLISVPVKGYQNSKIKIKGNIKLTGNPYNPDIQGLFTIPIISLPSAYTYAYDVMIKADDKILLNCPNIKFADSQMNINAEVNKNFSNGLVINRMNLNSTKFDLDTLSYVLANSPKNVGVPDFKIKSGVANVTRFEVGDINATNVTSDISLQNNIFYIKNIKADSFWGKVAGNINLNLKNLKTNVNMQGRKLSANLALKAITGQSGIDGVLDFDSNVSFIAGSQKNIIKTLNGNSNFIINNGRIGILGKFEYLIYAQNIISNNILKTTISAATKALTVKNTGVYKYVKGKIHLKNGVANIDWIKASGPTMSLYITGRYHILSDNVNLILLGRISNDIVDALGPFGDFSVNKVIAAIPKIGAVTSQYIENYTTNPDYENVLIIPELTPKTELPTKEFKVIISGAPDKQSSVKSFKWISKAKANKFRPQQNNSNISDINSIQHNKSENTSKNNKIPDFVKNLPDFK